MDGLGGGSSASARKKARKNNLRALHWDENKGRDDWNPEEMATIGGYVGDSKHPGMCWRGGGGREGKREERREG